MTDIVEAAQSIARFVQGADLDEFERNEMMSAVLQKLTVIGESASRLPKEFMSRFTEIPWWRLSAFAILQPMKGKA